MPMNILKRCKKFIVKNIVPLLLKIFPE